MTSTYLFTGFVTCSTNTGQDLLVAWQPLLQNPETKTEVAGLRVERRLGTDVVIFNACRTSDSELGEKLKEVAKRVLEKNHWLPEINVSFVTNETESANTSFNYWQGVAITSPSHNV